MTLQSLGLDRIASRFGLGGPVGGRKPALPPPFHKTMNPGDFMDTGAPTDVVLAAGTFQPMGDGTDDGYAVPAQQALRWGYGDQEHPDNQGYMYVIFIDDTAGDATQEDGLMRLVVSDANGLNKKVVGEWRTEELDGDPNDRAQRIALPEQGPLAYENDLLIIELNPDGADTVQPDFCTIRIPASLYQPIRRPA